MCNITHTLAKSNIIIHNYTEKIIIVFVVNAKNRKNKRANLH